MPPKRRNPDGGGASDTARFREAESDGGESTPHLDELHENTTTQDKDAAVKPGWALPEWQITSLALLLVGGVTIALYAEALEGTFCFHDEAVVLGNSDTQGAPLAGLLFHDYSGQELGGPSSVYGWRPLSVLSFRLNFAVSGHQPSAFKATNITLHAIAACLIYLCSYSLMSDCMPSWRSAAAPRTLVHAYAVAAGLLFSAHPIHTEAVVGVSGRSDVLWVVFLLPAFLLYRAATAATLQPTESSQRKLGEAFVGVWPALLGAAAFFGLSLLSNEKAILGMLLFAANDGVWWRWQRHAHSLAAHTQMDVSGSAGKGSTAPKARTHTKQQANADAEGSRVFGPGSRAKARSDDTDADSSVDVHTMQIMALNERWIVMGMVCIVYTWFCWQVLQHATATCNMHRTAATRRFLALSSRKRHPRHCTSKRRWSRIRLAVNRLSAYLHCGPSSSVLSPSNDRSHARARARSAHSLARTRTHAGAHAHTGALIFPRELSIDWSFQ
jgi:hypothetical protein